MRTHIGVRMNFSSKLVVLMVRLVLIRGVALVTWACWHRGNRIIVLEHSLDLIGHFIWVINVLAIQFVVIMLRLNYVRLLRYL